ncbi:MAG TPA: metallophosphoesterase [Acidobacteriota bacterium]
MNLKNNSRRNYNKIAPYLLALIGLVLFIKFPFAYHLGMFLVYFLVSLYVYTRLKRLLAASQLGRRIFSFVYLSLVLAYPLVELISHASQAKFLKYVLLFGYYSLPFLLYLFLLTALGELLLLLNRVVKIVPLKFIRNRAFARAMLGILLAGTMGIVVLGRIHYENIKVNEYRIEIPGQSAKIDHLLIALAADFHISDVTEPRLIETIIGKINSTHPDIVLLAGDLLEGDRPGFEVSRYAALFRRLRAKYGVYASLGNHDYQRVINHSNFFDLAGIKVLEDRFVIIDQSFCLAGRSDSHQGIKRSLDQVLGGAPRNFPIILMDHRPSNFAETLRHPVDIQLSAHTHHGQLFPINLITQLKYDLSWGYRHIQRTHFFVTCGVQTWGPPVRTVGDSEIMLIRVTFAHGRPSS